MTAQILDGKATAAAIKSDLTARVAALKAQGVTPGLGTLLVGDDPGSQWYVAGKHRDCAQVGIASIQRELPDTATQEEIEAVVRELNDDPACTGYIVQLPLPKGIDDQPRPGTDGPGQGRRRPAPDEPRPAGARTSPARCPAPRNGIVELLRRHGVEINGRARRGRRPRRHHRPLRSPLLLTRTVRERHGDPVPHRHPRPVRAAASRPTSSSPRPVSPHLVKPEDVKPGAAVLDVGVSRDEDGKIVGDVHPGVAEVAAWISPNPGGVGPMTRAQLLATWWRRPSARPARTPRRRGPMSG